MSDLSGGGGVGDVGTYRPGQSTFKQVDWDAKSRPPTRADLMKYAENATAAEQRVIQSSLTLASVGGAIGFAAGFIVGGWLPWHLLERRFKGSAPYVRVMRWSFPACGVLIPCLLAQKQIHHDMFDLSEDPKNILAFQLKRYVIARRQHMIVDSNMRDIDISKAKNDAKVRENEMTAELFEERFKTSMTGKIDSTSPEMALTKQSLTPFAQTGYKDPNTVTKI